MTKPIFRDTHWEEALREIRSRVMNWPRVVEAETFGNPTFRVGGKTFAVLDRYKGVSCVWVRCGDRRAELLARTGYFASPYDPKGLAVCRSLEDLDWDDFSRVLAASYEASL